MCELENSVGFLWWANAYLVRRTSKQLLNTSVRTKWFIAASRSRHIFIWLLFAESKVINYPQIEERKQETESQNWIHCRLGFLPVCHRSKRENDTCQNSHVVAWFCTLLDVVPFPTRELQRIDRARDFMIDVRHPGVYFPRKEPRFLLSLQCPGLWRSWKTKSPWHDGGVEEDLADCAAQCAWLAG